MKKTDKTGGWRGVFKKENVFTIPNLMSVIRLLLIPFIVWLYCFEKKHVIVFLLIVLSGVTDVLDGMIARRFNMVSELGKALDPVADKLTQGIVIICLVTRYRAMLVLVCMFAVKELLMAVMGLISFSHTDVMPSAKWYGKANTVLLYAVMGALILFPGIPPMVAYIMMGACAVSLVVSLLLYFLGYQPVLRGVKLSEKNGKLFKRWMSLTVIGLWAVVITVFIVDRETYFPGKPLAFGDGIYDAVFFVLGAFALKSFSTIIPSGLLYGVCGIMFELPTALVLSLAGTVIMISFPYLLGHLAGEEKTEQVIGSHRDLVFIGNGRKRRFIMPLIMRLPLFLSDGLVSAYFGAADSKYVPYLIASLIGSLPSLTAFTVIGAGIKEPASLSFILAVVFEAVLLAVSIPVYIITAKRSKKKGGLSK